MVQLVTGIVIRIVVYNELIFPCMQIGRVEEDLKPFVNYLMVKDAAGLFGLCGLSTSLRFRDRKIC